MGYGTEVNISKVSYSGDFNNSFEQNNYNYSLNINETITSWSLSSIKLGYLTKNNVYIGVHGSFISPLLGEGKVIKDNLWEKRIDISNSVYGDGSITDRARATFKYERYIGLDLSYDLTKYLTQSDDINLFAGIGAYHQKVFFGETIETYRLQYYASGSQSDFFYTENGKYKNYSNFALSAKLKAIYKYVYMEITIGQVNSIGIGMIYGFDASNGLY